MSNFNPLRRKLGLVMLVLACVLMVAWGRSTMREELIQVVLPDRLNGVHAFESSHSSFSWTSIKHPPLDVGTWYWSSIALRPGRESALIEMWPQYPDILRGKHPVAVRWVAHYGAIVLPLTALSAYLLLTKPRQPKPKSAP